MEKIKSHKDIDFNSKYVALNLVEKDDFTIQLGRVISIHKDGFVKFAPDSLNRKVSGVYSELIEVPFSRICLNSLSNISEMIRTEMLLFVETKLWNTNTEAK